MAFAFCAQLIHYACSVTQATLHPALFAKMDIINHQDNA